MKKTDKNLILFNMIFAVSLVISNVVTAKTITTGISLFNTAITLPGAVLCYAITFLMTDVISELWGKEKANQTVFCGFFCQVLASLLILLTQFLPASNLEMQKAYEMVLGQNIIFVVGSMVAYFASQTWDIWIFHKIRDKFQGNSNKRWIWNNLSTMTSQIIDTVLFIGISFGLGFGWLFNPAMHSTLITMMIGQYAIKFILALFDTPFFYLMTNRKQEDL